VDEPFEDISVMGEFNNWQPAPMDFLFEDNHMKYSYETIVPVGYKYRYQFIINGEIRVNPNQPTSESTLLHKITNFKIVEEPLADSSLISPATLE
jgi:1,4-alpha-glucan branching enzyme